MQLIESHEVVNYFKSLIKDDTNEILYGAR